MRERTATRITAVQGSKFDVRRLGSLSARPGCVPGLYGYRFDSQTTRSGGLTLTVVGGNE